MTSTARSTPRTVFRPQSEIYPIPGNQELDEATREYRRRCLFTPFHSQLQTLIDERLAQGRPVRLVGIHSFTPVYHGQPRALEAGVLFGEAKDYAQRLIDGLSQHPLKVAAMNRTRSTRWAT